MSKNTCERSHPINIRLLKKHGYLGNHPISGILTWSHPLREEKTKILIQSIDSEDSPCFQLTYSDTHEKSIISTTSTLCFFGKARYWFLCPESCGRRVGVLYFLDRYFACRRCHDLAYQSQQGTHTGTWGVFAKCLSGEIHQKAEAMRIKYWKGKPTKRCARLMRKIRSLPDLKTLQNN